MEGASVLKNSLLTLKVKDPSLLFFCSDLHFFHAKIIDYCNRPFTNAEHMNEVMLQYWNDVVPVSINGKKPIVVCLGDIVFGRYSSKEAVNEFLHKLNGDIILVLGNHDRNTEIYKWSQRFSYISQYLEIKVEDPELNEKVRISCHHYRQVKWNEGHKGSWHLYGHSHRDIGQWFPEYLVHKMITVNSPMESDALFPEIQDCYNQRALHVGVDTTDYSPVSYSFVKNWMLQRPAPKATEKND